MMVVSFIKYIIKKKTKEIIISSPLHLTLLHQSTLSLRAFNYRIENGGHNN